MNHRQRGKKIGATLIAILIISIVTLTVAYAALSETLSIQGSAQVNSSTWDIKLENSTSQTNATTGTATYTTPVVNGTTISYSVGLTKPSDTVTLYFDVLNSGDVTGEITSIISSTPTCTSATGNTADADLVCNNLEVSLIYSDGSSVQVGDVINTEGYRCLNGTTSSNTQAVIKLVVKLKDSMTSLPTSQVNITNLKHDIIYSQTDKSCTTFTCFTEETKIAVENGYKNIKDIKVGDYVYSYNLETKTKELNKVLRTFIHQKDEIYTLKVNNQLIHTTEEHPFYVINKGWVNTEKLNFNDKLLSVKTGQTSIQNISKRNNKTYVYNIEVENNHNYLITTDEILVHNKPDRPGSGGGSVI